MDVFHKPVLLEEAVGSLCCRPGGTYVDGTIGGGGHAQAILEKTSPSGLLIGIDADEEALAEAERRLRPFGNRKTLIKGNFADIGQILKELHIEKVDGILLDLGVSSHQLESADRGFSFSLNAPLDMRMDRSRKLNAYDLINTFSVQELEKIIRGYGEETMAGRIVRAISEQRIKAPIRTTYELAQIIVQSVPSKFRRRKIHPATKTFQAIRIAVNNELANLHRAVSDGISLLHKQGRFCIISFHSLEDRIVKNIFRSWEKGCICPPDIPICTCHRKPLLKIITKKPIIPEVIERTNNPRARSAKLRTAERIQS
jgi:16S rRNA (cytosine1402-N4)-methyltransferase